MRLPVRSVSIAARAERALRAVGLGQAGWARGLADRARSRWLAKHPLTSPLTSVEMAGVRFLLPSRYVPAYLEQPFDPLTTARVRAYLQPGMTVLDVGAHIGYYTLLAANRVGPRGRVFAVEPAEENLALLRENVARAVAGNVTVLPFAAGGRDAVRSFEITDSSDTHGFYQHPLQPTVRTVQVQQRALDGVIEGPLDLVKIDVEGAELEVLAGLTRILARGRRLALVVEWNPACLERAGRNALDLPAVLEALGFGLEVLDDAAGRVRPLAEVAAMVRSGSLPDSWFVNLWGECAGPAVPSSQGDNRDP
jgi:FkbM family methyltransferase